MASPAKPLTHRDLVAQTTSPQRPVSRGLSAASNEVSPRRLQMYEAQEVEFGFGESPKRPASAGRAPTQPKYTIDHLGIDQPSKEMLQEMFDYFDSDNSGTIDKKEFAKVYRESFENFGAPMTDRDLERVFARLDRDGSGKLSFDEFCILMMSRMKL